MVAGCAADPVPVAAPRPPATELAASRELHHRLPGAVDDRDRRDTDPESVLTAAWGDPPVVLRCGVADPAGLTATSEIVEVEGVDWFLTEPAPAYVFTTVGRRANIEVAVPRSVDRAAATAPLVDLAGAVDAAVPEG